MREMKKIYTPIYFDYICSLFSHLKQINIKIPHYKRFFEGVTFLKKSHTFSHFSHLLKI